MSKDLTQFKQALLSAVPSMPPHILDDLRWEDKQDFISEQLFSLLGWNDEFETHGEGQFMTYVEWKEPDIGLDDLTPIKNLGLSLDNLGDEAMLAFIKEYGEDEPESMDDYYDIQLKMGVFFLNYYNQALAKHGLQLVEMGAYENAYLLCTINDKGKIETLQHALAELAD